MSHANESAVSRLPLGTCPLLFAPSRNHAMTFPKGKCCEHRPGVDMHTGSRIAVGSSKLVWCIRCSWTRQKERWDSPAVGICQAVWLSWLKREGPEVPSAPVVLGSFEQVLSWRWLMRFLAPFILTELQSTRRVLEQVHPLIKFNATFRSHHFRERENGSRRNARE